MQFKKHLTTPKNRNTIELKQAWSHYQTKNRLKLKRSTDQPTCTAFICYSMSRLYPYNPIPHQRHGVLRLASLFGGFQLFGLGLEWHFLHDLVVIGNETLPWQTPHLVPNKIADILITLAFFWGINIFGWQFEQCNHWVWGLCGKTTSGMEAFTSRTISRSITKGSIAGSKRS